MALARRRRERELRNGRQTEGYRDEDAAGQTPELGVFVLSEWMSPPLFLGLAYYRVALGPNTPSGLQNENVNFLHPNAPSLVVSCSCQAVVAVTPPPP